MSQVQPTGWDSERLESDLLIAIDLFRQSRINEPLQEYLLRYDSSLAAVAEILELTEDLRQLAEDPAKVLSDVTLAEATRYLMAPPISKDDLETLARVTMARSLVAKEPERALKLMDVISAGLDPKRFPWVESDRPPTESERSAAVVATAALIATRQVETARRNDGKTQQEQAVMAFLKDKCKLQRIDPVKIKNLGQKPKPGCFWSEAEIAGRKADVTVTLWDGRIMPIECKVSNSSTNSYKRINNDAAVKAVAWNKALGEDNVVPAAVLAGVFALANLEYAQNHGLYLFWEHSLEPLGSFIDAAR